MAQSAAVRAGGTQTVSAGERTGALPTIRPARIAVAWLLFAFGRFRLTLHALAGDRIEVFEIQKKARKLE